MEATKLKKKKGTINKGKLKKTIKNVICRPDPVSWYELFYIRDIKLGYSFVLYKCLLHRPTVTEAEENALTSALIKHRINIPDLKKPHWNELKLIPKSERPKPQPIE